MNLSNPISPNFRVVIAKSRLFAITESPFDSDFAAFDIEFFGSRFSANKRYRFRPKLIQPDIETAFFDSQAVQKAHRRFHALPFRGVIRLSLRGRGLDSPKRSQKSADAARFPQSFPDGIQNTLQKRVFFLPRLQIGVVFSRSCLEKCPFRAAITASLFVL